MEQNDATVFRTGKPQTKKRLSVLSVALTQKGIILQCTVINNIHLQIHIVLRVV